MSHGAGSIAAIVLAAGSSRRFGPDNKLLADVGGKPLLLRVVDPLVACGLSPIVVVTGHERERVEAALTGMPVRLVHNERHLQGMGGSVAVGAASVDPGAAGVLITPGDTPSLAVALVLDLLSVFGAEEGRKIVYPVTTRGAQRNPVVWPARFLPDLMCLDGDAGAKALISRYAADAVAVSVIDDSSLIDIDGIEDLERWRATARPGRGDG
jgi:molybdenum cofactor cytidylyltransferase